MYVQISYETALARHPHEVAAVMAQLAKGKSREKGSPPETLTWGYNFAVSIQSMSFRDMLNGTAPVETRTLEERTHVGLTASKGRWRGIWTPIGGFHPVPPEVMEYLKPMMENR